MSNKIWKQPERASKIVDLLMKRWRGQSQQNASILSGVWRSIVGDTIASHTSPVQIIHKKLVVKVESSAWMNELTFLREKIKIEAKLRLSEHGITVEDVIFRLS